MKAGEVAEILLSLQKMLGQSSVVLRCDCHNLETVYISRTESGTLRVSDRGETFAYLAHDKSATYQQVNDINMGTAADVCAQAGSAIVSGDSDGFPHIECIIDPKSSVADAVSRVAEAVDGVFQLALRE